jgi:hypothetical protein
MTYHRKDRKAPKPEVNNVDGRMVRVLAFAIPRCASLAAPVPRRFGTYFKTPF